MNHPERPITPELRLALLALTHEHAWRLDHGAADTLHELYAEDGELLQLPPRDLIGREAIRAWGADRVKLPRVSRHVETNHRFFWDGERLRGTLYATVYRCESEPATETRPFMVGDYLDEYVQVNGTWLIRQRIIAKALRVAPAPATGGQR
ncbi:nuclear transport factor 2 family protein [Pseudacidovorax sp. NFM-22]|uniref:nuclear transport factor 2 family protein n=1 Tax=Pseudacidovorax sp. NFM-22 TaxID=2744469 RepID=UPI001F2415DD|nr:nuclear transport factor 2 family protein [Pseudacidovorax sp. NFM-22]